MSADEPATSRDFQKLIDAMKALTGTMGKTLDHMGSSYSNYEKSNRDFMRNQEEIMDFEQKMLKEREDEAKKRQDDHTKRLHTTTQGTITHLKALSGNSSDIAGSFSKLSEMVGGVVMVSAFNELLSWTGSLVSTYKDLAASGQSFSGGLLDMSRSAAEAGLSLDNYASFIKTNSVLMAHFGRKDLTDIAKQVRFSSEKFGMFGYTVQGLDDIVAAYAQRQLLFDKLDATSKKEATDNIMALAQETAGLSDAFGKSREQITKDASEAMHNTSFVIAMQSEAIAKMKDFGPNMEKAITTITAGYGQTVPKMFADIFAESAGGGVVGANKNYQTLNSLGAGDIADQIVIAQQRIAKGEKQSDVFAKMAPEMLKMWHANGNDELHKALAYKHPELGPLINEMDAFLKDLGDKKKQEAAEKYADKMAPLTAHILAFDNAIQRITGEIKDHLLGGVGMFGKLLDGLVVAFDWVAVPIKAFGDMLGAMSSWGDKIFGSGEDLKKYDSFGHKLDDMGKAIDGTWDPIVTFRKALSGLSSVSETLTLVIGGLVAAFAGYKIVKSIMGMFSNVVDGMLNKIAPSLFSSKVGVMNVEAAVVNINGKGLGDLKSSLSGNSEGDGGGWKGFLKKALGSVVSFTGKNHMLGRAGMLTSLMGMVTSMPAINYDKKTIEDHFKNQNKTDDVTNTPQTPQGDSTPKPPTQPPNSEPSNDQPVGFWDSIGKGVTGLATNLSKEFKKDLGYLGSQEFKQHARAAAPWIGGAVGASIGSVAGGAGGALAGGIGSVPAAVGGEMIGSAAGAYVANWFAEKLFGTANSTDDKVKTPDIQSPDNAAAKKPDRVLDPRDEWTSQINQDNDKLMALGQGNVDKDSENKRLDLINEIAKLRQLIQQQTELIARQNNRLIEQNDKQIRIMGNN